MKQDDVLCGHVYTPLTKQPLLINGHVMTEEEFKNFWTWTKNPGHSFDKETGPLEPKNGRDEL